MPAITVAGLTCPQVQQKVTLALHRYFKDPPDVKVGIARMTTFQVLVNGALLRSGIVTLTDGARLSDLLADVGYLPNADLSRIRVTRIASGTPVRMMADFQRSLEGSAENKFNDPVLVNGDSIFVDTVITPEAPKTIVVVGEVKRGGTLTYRPGMTVRDALDDTFGL